MNVADNIKQLRLLKSLSQKQTALALGMDQPQYSRLESGKVEPTLSSLEKIAALFEVSVADLVRDKAEPEAEVNLSILEKVKLLAQLDEKEMNSILTIIDMALAKKRLKDNLANVLNLSQ